MEETVTDGDNAPIAGPTVVVGGINLPARTDRDGSYQIEDVPVGTHDVTASADGYYSRSAAVTVVGGTVTQDFVLPATLTWTVSGTVMDVGANALEEGHHHH